MCLGSRGELGVLCGGKSRGWRDSCDFLETQKLGVMRCGERKDEEVGDSACLGGGRGGSKRFCALGTGRSKCGGLCEGGKGREDAFRLFLIPKWRKKVLTPLLCKLINR